MGVMRMRDERGQMTVELAAAFPVLIIVAVIAVNALAFFSECAAFDNVFRDAVRVHATSPAAGQGIEQSSALVQTALSAAFDAENEAVRVSAEGVSGGHTRFTGTLESVSYTHLYKKITVSNELFSCQIQVIIL